MGTKYGQCKAPLSFKLCPDDDPADEEDLTDDFERMIYLTPHQDQGYQYDNGMVYDKLKALLVNSTAFTWIRVHDWARNGREAWKSLLSHYEGTTEQNRDIEAAYNTIRNSTYQGERRNWTFQSFYHAHQEVHYDLELYGEIISKNKKVTDFLRGITDPTCSVAKGIVLASPEYLNNFTKAALYIVSTLNVTLINPNQKRNISHVNTGGKKCQGKSNGKGNKKLTRSYSPAEWRALSEDEHKKILEARAKAKAEKAKRGNDSNAKWTAVAVKRSNESEHLVLKGIVAEVLRQKNIQPAHTDEAGDHMTSRCQRQNKSARINMISSSQTQDKRYISRTKRNNQ